MAVTPDQEGEQANWQQCAYEINTSKNFYLSRSTTGLISK